MNSHDVLTHMGDVWSLATARREKIDAIGAVLEGVAFMYQENITLYKRLKTDEAKIGHFRQLFTTWKAVCRKLEAKFKEPSKAGEEYVYPFHMDYDQALRAFPLFFEELLPSLYYVLFKKNIFLGVAFTEEDRDRINKLEREFLRKGLEEERKRNDALFRQMFFGGIRR